MRGFNHNNYCLFKVDCTSFNKIHILLVSEIRKFKNVTSSVKMPVQEIGYPFVLAAVDRVIKETVAYDEIFSSRLAL